MTLDMPMPEPWQMPVSDFVRSAQEIGKPTPFIVQAQERLPYGAISITFLPMQGDTVKPLARNLRGQTYPAAAGDIAFVTGRPFYTNDTQRLGRERLLAWLSGKINTYQASVYADLVAAYQENHRHAVEEALTTGKPVPPQVMSDYPRLSALRSRWPVLDTTSPAPQRAMAKVSRPCPKCGFSLVQRRNKQTGTAFLGCANYPTCRYSEPVASAGGKP